MSEKTKWLYIGTDIDCALFTEIVAGINLDVSFLNSIPELFPLLSNPNFNNDYISIEMNTLENFTKTNGLIDTYEVLNTLNTLIRSTVYRKDTGKISKRNTKLGVAVDLKLSARSLKEMAITPAISFVILSPSLETKTNDVIDTVRDVAFNNVAMPKRITELFKKPKKKELEIQEQIKMTARQHQIYNLVTNRAASNKIIAKTLGITESTVKLHMSSILKKYGVRTRTQLVLFSKDQK